MALPASSPADSATAEAGSFCDSAMGAISCFCFFCCGSAAFTGYTFLLRPTFFFSFGSFYYFGGFRDFGSALTFLGFGGWIGATGAVASGTSPADLRSFENSIGFCLLLLLSAWSAISPFLLYLTLLAQISWNENDFCCSEGGSSLTLADLMTSNGPRFYGWGCWVRGCYGAVKKSLNIYRISIGCTGVGMGTSLPYATALAAWTMSSLNFKPFSMPMMFSRFFLIADLIFLTSVKNRSFSILNLLTGPPLKRLFDWFLILFRFGCNNFSSACRKSFSWMPFESWYLIDTTKDLAFLPVFNYVFTFWDLPPLAALCFLVLLGAFSLKFNFIFNFIFFAYYFWARFITRNGCLGGGDFTDLAEDSTSELCWSESCHFENSLNSISSSSAFSICFSPFLSSPLSHSIYVGSSSAFFTGYGGVCGRISDS